jgi:hypothetical protein
MWYEKIVVSGVREVTMVDIDFFVMDLVKHCEGGLSSPLLERRPFKLSEHVCDAAGVVIVVLNIPCG